VALLHADNWGYPVSQPIIIGYAKSRYLFGLRWFCALLAAAGIGLGCFYVFSNPMIAIATFVAGLFVTAWPLNVENSFHHPKELRFQMQANQALSLDNSHCELRAIWGCPWFVILSVRTSGATQSRFARATRHRQILLGRDCLSDQEWHSFARWRVWRQRN
jgi:hypothetical protein